MKTENIFWKWRKSALQGASQQQSKADCTSVFADKTNIFIHFRVCTVVETFPPNLLWSETVQAPTDWKRVCSSQKFVTITCLYYRTFLISFHMCSLCMSTGRMNIWTRNAKKNSFEYAKKVAIWQRVHQTEMVATCNFFCWKFRIKIILKTSSWLPPSSAADADILANDQSCSAMKNVHKSCGKVSFEVCQWKKKLVQMQMQMQVIPVTRSDDVDFRMKSLSSRLIHSHFNRHSLRVSGRLRCPHHASFHKVHKIRLRLSELKFCGLAKLVRGKNGRKSD